MVPTHSQWEDFSKLCDELDVWSWPPDYQRMKILDGLLWTFELEIGERRVAFDSQMAGCPREFYSSLMRLHRLLQAMTGWRPPER